jgi:thiol-disulfide isomerase/thioredoxin
MTCLPVRFLPVAALAAMLGVAACTSNGAPPQGTEQPVVAADGGHDHGDGTVVHLLKEPYEVADFTVTDLDGRTIRSADLRGKVVLVNFWATWCPPCRAEIPDLVKLQDKYRDKLVILGVSEDEVGPEPVKAFAAEHKMNYPIVMATPELQKIFQGVSALPTTFVVDPEGRVQRRHEGLLDPHTTELETQFLAGLRKDVTVERVEDAKKALLASAAQAKEIPGVDLTVLTPEQRTAALKALNAENCTCGCGLTIAACRINDPACSVSLPLAKKIVEQIAKGETPNTAAP